VTDGEDPGDLEVADLEDDLRVARPPVQPRPLLSLSISSRSSGKVSS
jgi:hypothetical protein